MADEAKNNQQDPNKDSKETTPNAEKSKTSGVISNELKENLEKRPVTDKKEKIYDSNELVEVKISYPKEWKKAKHFKEGQVVKVHPLVAKNYESSGIGKVVRTSVAKAEAREPKEI